MSVDINNLPLHVAITMDGNGRWAKNRKLPRTSGHDKGLNVVKEIVKASADIGIKYLTLYIFSTENWKRTEQEVGFLMNLIHIHLLNELKFYEENQIKLQHIGDLETLPKLIQKDLTDAVEKTKNYNKMTLNLAINYGGRNELLRGIKKIVYNNVKEEDISEETIKKYLDMPESPDVDLMIRTGGEKRLSNFLLWHVAYSEFVFKDTLWPDYTKEEYFSDLETFQNRNRRFGAETSNKK